MVTLFPHYFRYLDVDMLKRSKDSDQAMDDGLSAEHKRAMDSIARSLVEDPNPVVAVPVSEAATEALEVVRAVEAAEVERAHQTGQLLVIMCVLVRRKPLKEYRRLGS